ncbi:MAG: UDP-N-acetylmuramate dehydrogenase [Patescibacteria group bacterium]|nr:UDP-N-acetylmuramate dehydrogenase [Patescibacteria group bacterium]
MELIDLQKGVSLKNYSSYGIGGGADYLLPATATDQLIEIIKLAKRENLPWIVIGGGTNILFPDKGVRGIVIQVKTHNLEISGEKITADSGTPLALVVNRSIQEGLTGLENWAGIPGTIGGAVYGNAGVPGSEMKDYIESVEIYDSKSDKTEKLPLEEMEFSYRDSGFKRNGKIILRVTLKLTKSDDKKADTAKTIKERLAKQPTTPSAGSFFKNPTPEKPAGLLIDQCGLKGKCIGDAQISDKHANFIINLGNATQKDILELAKMAKESVKEKFSIELIPEVQIFDELGNKTKL